MSKEKILVVDDDDMLRQTLKVTLDYAGYSSEECADSSQALDAARRAKPGAILLDLYMPKTSGLDILKALKADAALSRVPVILFTGSGEVKDVTEGIQAGAFDYIVKPVDYRLLLDKIGKALKVNARP